MKLGEPKICTSCRDSDGNPKYAYPSEKVALKAAWGKRKVRAYWCPYGEGWHLTSS